MSAYQWHHNPCNLLKENDILFARTGGTVGKSYLVDTVPDEAIYAGYLICTRYSDELCPRYLKYFMESSLYWKQSKNGTTARAQPNCSGQTLSKMLFPLPPVKEQFCIAAYGEMGEDENEFISLTDIARYKSDDPTAAIQN